MRRPHLSVLLALASLLSACGGGASQPPGIAPVTAAGATGTARFVITVPSAQSVPQSARRSPAYIATTTASITIDVKPHGSATSISGYPQTANLTATSAGCTSTLVSTQCTIAYQLGPQSYDLSFTTFDGMNGTGNQLSAAQTVQVTIVEGAVNTVPIALGGIPTAVRVVASAGAVTGSQNSVFTLPPSATGNVTVYGVDADGNVILGAGAPAVTASSSSGQVTVTPPSSSLPNTVQLTTTSATAIARVTATVTPVAGTGTGAVSTAFTVQVPTLPLIYVADYGSSSVFVYDGLGNKLTPSGGFIGINLPYAIAFDQANGIVYVGGGNSTFFLKAFDRNGTSQAVSGTFPGATSSNVLSLTYVPANQLIYDVNLYETVAAYDANGNAKTLTPGTFSTIGSHAFAYDPSNGYLYSASGTVYAYDVNGTHETLSGTFPGLSSGALSVAYNGFNGFLYVTSVYPSMVLAFDQNGNAVSLSGTFPNIDGNSNQPQAIAADAVTGHVFVLTNTGYMFAFDQNGNALWTVSGLSDPLSLVLVPPQ